MVCGTILVYTVRQCTCLRDYNTEGLIQTTHIFRNYGKSLLFRTISPINYLQVLQIDRIALSFIIRFYRRRLIHILRHISSIKFTDYLFLKIAIAHIDPHLLDCE